eukprot:5612821-Alexandrium_andersonii.AAC.1
MAAVQLPTIPVNTCVQVLGNQSVSLNRVERQLGCTRCRQPMLANENMCPIELYVTLSAGEYWAAFGSR